MRGAELVWALVAAVLGGCTNNPYPDADDSRKILYIAYSEPPKTLDPQVSYTVIDHQVIGNVYDTLLEYHYLERPYRLIPGIADAVPEATPLPDGRVAYRFRLRPDLRFDEDPAFALGAPERRTRQLVAADVAFALARAADPLVNCPVAETLAHIDGFAEFGERLTARRAQDEAFADQRIDRQYAAAGGIAGVRVDGDLDLTIVLSGPYPQILYWFAMPFTAPVAWEAIEYYDGEGGRPAFAEHPVATGPFRLGVYDKRSRIVLERNPSWYGIRHPEWHAPGATYPTTGEPGDEAEGLLAYAGRPLPFLERVEFRRDQEQIPTFTKFLQGYYDASGIIRESFDRVVQNGALSPEMAQYGMRLEKSVSPALSYLGFNMDDPVVGVPAAARGRRLRQALSLAVDTKEYLRLFTNGRGIPAQTPVPPGIFGYEPGYANPYRALDVERAKALLREARYADGVDADTGKPLHLTFDVQDTSARALLSYQFFVDSWRRIGVDVEIAPTDYNQFQDKMRRGAFQVFIWGWVADYPDPENFLFLLYGPMGRTKNNGPNSANFSDPRYDTLFEQMRMRANDDERMRLIREMRALIEVERPWIELVHPEDYLLQHTWLRNGKATGLSIPTAKYRDVDAPLRARLCTAWNRPVRWPGYVLAVLVGAVLVPSVRTLRRRLA